jgi:signal transduction histidine kinase
MRLSEAIRANSRVIINEWESFARTLIPAGNNKSPLALRNHIKQILAFIAADIESAQTAAEQVRKSHGRGVTGSEQSAAEIHAALRMAGGFDTDQMVSEYRALRASVLKVWMAQSKDPNNPDFYQLIRFNESIDQQLAESLRYYNTTIHRARELLIGILSHDLRGPISAARMSAQLALSMDSLSDRQAKLLNQIVVSADRANKILISLFDLAGARLGSGLPIAKGQMCMGSVGKQLVEETVATHPNRTITLNVLGNTEGEWDQPRIGQVFSNLLGNAVQYGSKDSPIQVTIRGRADDVVVSVHNEGAPIPRETIGRIFDSLVRGDVQSGKNGRGSTNLGLGLFITKEIVSAHGGEIDVTSTEKGGTTFIARFPRATPNDSAAPAA